jgi:hypothetical protein
MKYRCDNQTVRNWRKHFSHRVQKLVNFSFRHHWLMTERTAHSGQRRRCHKSHRLDSLVTQGRPEGETHIALPKHGIGHLGIASSNQEHRIRISCQAHATSAHLKEIDPLGFVIEYKYWLISLHLRYVCEVPSRVQRHRRKDQGVVRRDQYGALSRRDDKKLESIAMMCACFT